MFQYTSIGWVALTGNMTAKTMTLMVVMVVVGMEVVLVVCVFMLTSLRGDVLAARSRRQLLVL